MKAKKFVKTKSHSLPASLKSDDYYQVFKVIKDYVFASGEGYVVKDDNGDLKGFDSNFFE